VSQSVPADEKARRASAKADIQATLFQRLAVRTTAHLFRLNDFNALDAVSASYSIHHIHCFNNLSKDRVAPVEMWLRRMSDEN
jgi:hypothetical protein